MTVYNATTCDREDTLAVVIVCYNAGKHLQSCLAALSRQTLRPTRVFVVDNASQDGAVECVPEVYPEAEVIRCPNNLGFAAANNLAIRAAGDCRWIALLNADAYAEPTWLEELMRATGQQPECSFFGGKLLSATDPRVFDGTGDVYHVSGRAWRRDRGTLASRPSDLELPVIGPCAAAALYRRDALVEVGGFDEAFFCFFEDVDLCLRLRLTGHRYAYVPEAVVLHVGSALSGVHSDFSIYHGHRNLVWAYLKNMPGPLFWWYLPQHLLLNLMTLALFIAKGHARVILRAKCDALRMLPRMWRQRRRIQRQRVVGLRELQTYLAAGWLTPYWLRPRKETERQASQPIRPAMAWRKLAPDGRRASLPGRGLAE
jgi:GT2 family glycosyltransferase